MSSDINSLASEVDEYYLDNEHGEEFVDVNDLGHDFRCEGNHKPILLPVPELEPEHDKLQEIREMLDGRPDACVGYEWVEATAYLMELADK